MLTCSNESKHIRPIITFSCTAQFSCKVVCALLLLTVYLQGFILLSAVALFLFFVVCYADKTDRTHLLILTISHAISLLLWLSFLYSIMDYWTMPAVFTSQTVSQSLCPDLCKISVLMLML